ncbi:MAG: hypothetical protein QME72_11825, partial [Rhodococcus sp. (in: high G+C Gram-positive bacteria)]|nr:hypothetical protein [Rhodococcus sp. (in: high G+C Gram-positive bacteria)]
ADQRNLAARTVLITDKGAPENLVRRVEILLDQFGLLDVVEAGDSMAAMDLMRTHLDHLGDSYRQMDRLRNP